jgi:hypothetical protein
MGRRLDRDLASALNTGNSDRRAWFDRRVNQIEDFAWKKLSASDRRTDTCTLGEAQFVIARVHGFQSWPQFATHINALTRTTSPSSQFESAAEAIITGDVVTLRRLLRANPNSNYGSDKVELGSPSFARPDAPATASL